MKEFRDLLGKIEGRYYSCHLAVLIAPGGVAPTVHELQYQKSEKGTLVALIGAGDLNTLIHCNGRSETLKELHQRAVAPEFDPIDDKETSPQR